ncbi:hypothetical protein [Sphingopyxis sp.]|uniref:hypothetical protein n=1 Tax=Sphingopyxis sp. TaxID=1908224 RepID=UPI0025E60578|nr:hypothetical protein [Sphingopyxis sp.]
MVELCRRGDEPDRSPGPRPQGIGEVEAATPAELRLLARRYLVDDKALVIKAVSDKVGK